MCAQQKLPHGSMYKLKNGCRLVLLDQISSGSQAEVYRAIDADKTRYMAVKYLFGDYCRHADKELYYKKTEKLFSVPAFHPDLVWGEGVSECDSQYNFIYAMPLVTDHEPVSLIMKDPDAYPLSMRLALCRKIAEIFRAIHEKGFIYGDISGSNILFQDKGSQEPDVKVIDCEGIIPQNLNLGLSGTGLYRAPEVLLGKVPSIESDIHALAVLTFRILCGDHPLDGAYTKSQPFTTENIIRFFGKQPFFIFDGTCNSPSQPAQKRFESLSHPLQLYYYQVFSQDALKGRQHRSSLDVFCRLMELS